MGRYSPYDLTHRRAAGHPNGSCENCGSPAASLNADYCSGRCRDKHAEQKAQEERWRQMAEDEYNE